jgi:D-alanyl-D-alanine carboxypeptidase
VRFPALFITYLILVACQGSGPSCARSSYAFPERLLAAVDLGDAKTPSGRALSPAAASKLERRWQELQADENIESLGIAVAGPDGMWTSPEDPLTPRYYWASVGKLFTSVLLEQLVQEGRLRLDASLADWYPELPGAGDITLAMLLSHRSGFTSHNEFAAFRDRDTPATPEEVAEFLRDRPLLFCPGTNWYYSNSGYLLLGRIIEALIGRDYAEAVRERIAEPIGASTLEALPQGSRPDDVAPILPPDGARAMAPGDPFSAGNIVSTPADMLRFLIAVLDGRLTGGAALETMAAQLYPMFEPRLFYGRGIMAYDLTDDLWVGHSGGTPGAKAVIAYSFATRTYVAVALTGEGSVESVANWIFQALAGAGD